MRPLCNSKRKSFLWFGGELTTDYISDAWKNAVYGPAIVYRDAFVIEAGDKIFNDTSIFTSYVNYINKALEDIEYLKTTDISLYQIYYDRIALERISIYYMAIECAPNSFSNLSDMKAIVKEDALKFGITMYDLQSDEDGKGYVKDLYL